MGAVNKVILIGNLGAEPEMRYTPAGAPWVTFRVATNDSWTDRSGKRQERTEWHKVVAFGKLAEVCKQYLGKGRPAYVEGRLQTREWTDKENQKRFSTEVIAGDVVFLSGGSKREGSPEPTDAAAFGMEPPPGPADLPADELAY